ncbi:MBL fold metallo-hydrolase [Corynebacterium breve]|uniref:MBL fold metallo-hydrolase n=1 Tax=Corynebacterium breve TaxID=3049799 RepID=A0ABY8VGH9_9CORY|nr:MBL fold metallo-hydrolase [Corynebacterium breve]WIM68754.1 MBL fold metallo-hydrolase [Corynebacterium breve]
MTETLSLHHISVGKMDNNSYLIASDSKALLIDAPTDADALLKLADDAGVTITDVLTTHRHADHVQALVEVLEHTGATHWASYLDSPALPAKVDRELDHGDALEFAGHSIPVIVLRGHTPGGACVAIELEGKPNLFVGDSIFPGGLGKTGSEGDFVRLYNDAKERVFDVYPDETVIWPGHGANTTVGAERPHLAEWWQRRW